MTSEVECDIHCTIKNLTLKISGGQLPPCPPAMYGLAFSQSSSHFYLYKLHCFSIVEEVLTRQVSGLWAWVQCRMFHSRWVMDGCYLGQRGSLFGQSYQRQAKHVKSCSAVVVRPFLFACRDVDVDLQDCHVQVCADVLQCVRIPMDRLTRRLSWIVFPVQNNAANRFYLLSLDSLAWACFDVWKIWYVQNLSHSGVWLRFKITDSSYILTPGSKKLKCIWLKN